MEMLASHERDEIRSETRIRKRIRRRILSYLPLKITLVCFFILLAGLEHPLDASPLIITLASASEVDDDGPSLRSRGTMSKADIEMAASVIQKAKKKPKNAKKEKKPLTMNQILIKAGKRGLGGGLPGAVAGVVQVLTLMWLRCVIYKCWRQYYLDLFCSPPWLTLFSLHPVTCDTPYYASNHVERS